MKSIGDIAAKWKQRAGAAGSDYTKGVQATTKDWAQHTAAADAAWQQGVQVAVTNGRFVKGVNNATTAHWREASVNKGSARYPTGVAQGEPRYVKGFSPYADALTSITYPPRSATGNPANFERSRIVSTTLHQKKLTG